MTKVDLAFSLFSQQAIPADHGYVLYGALSQNTPTLHTPNGIGIHPIRGQQIGDRRMSLTSNSCLVLRLDTNKISQALPLAGKQLDVLGAKLTSQPIR